MIPIPMDKAQTQFLELMRAGLWGVAADPENFKPDSVDWRAVLRVAKEQTMMVVVADGIETLPKELWPAKEVMMKLAMMRIKTEQMHSLLNSTIAQIVNALDAESVPSVLLKGQGIAQNYLRPMSRSCGDIDLYTGHGGYKRAFEIIEGLHEGRAHKEAAECEHHLHTSLNGVEVEIHRLASFMHGKRMNANFQKWTQESMDALFGSGELETWDNGGTAVGLAPATFNAFFILHHAVRHMTTEGVGFRQICDWMMLLHRCHDHVDVEVLDRKLKELHMEKIWQEFGRLAVNFLGLPVEELPLAPADVAPTRKTYLLLRHIFISGNFGRFDANGRDHSKVPYLTRKWRSFTFQSKRLVKLFRLFPGYATEYMWHWLISAVVRFVTQSDS